MSDRTVRHALYHGNTDGVWAKTGLALRTFGLLGLGTLLICSGMYVLSYERFSHDVSRMTSGSRITIPEGSAAWEPATGVTEADIAAIEEEAEAWDEVPGLASTARERFHALLLHSTEINPTRYVDAATEVLAVDPLATKFWSLLAWTRMEAGEPSDEVREALAMSYLVERREPYVRMQRTEVGLRLWRELDEEQRGKVVGDVLAVWPKIPKLNATRIGAILSAMDPTSLDQVSEALCAKPGGDSVGKHYKLTC